MFDSAGCGHQNQSHYCSVCIYFTPCFLLMSFLIECSGGYIINEDVSLQTFVSGISVDFLLCVFLLHKPVSVFTHDFWVYIWYYF